MRTFRTFPRARAIIVKLAVAGLPLAAAAGLFLAAVWIHPPRWVRQLRLLDNPHPMLVRAGAESEEREERGVRPGYPDEAMQWRVASLRDENGHVDPDGLMRAKAHVDRMRAERPAGPAAAGITSGSWTSIGPGFFGGRVRAMVFDPTDATGNTIFIGSVSGGIWKTTSGGTSWTHLDDFMSNLAVTSLVISADGQTLFASTGEGFFNGDAIQGAGIFRSANGGVTWTQLPSTSSAPTPPLTAANFHFVNRLARSPNGTLLAASLSGLFRSTDGGASFSRPAGIPVYSGIGDGTGPGDGLTDVKFAPGSDLNAVAAGYKGAAFYSTDGGVNWTPAVGLPASSEPVRCRVELAYAPGNPLIVFASVDFNSGQLYKSVDGGHTYSLVSVGAGDIRPLRFQGSYDNALWINPFDANMIVWGGIDLFRSTDGGASWSRISMFLDGGSAHPDQHVIVSHPLFDNKTNFTMYFGNDGGIQKQADIRTAGGDCTPAPGYGWCSQGWSYINNDLAITQFYGGAGHPGSGRIVGGAQDNYTIRYDPALPDAANHWEYQAGGDGGFSAYDPVDPDLAYGEFVFAQIHRTSPLKINGHEFITCYVADEDLSLKPNALTDAGRAAAFIAPFILDPNDSNRLLVGAARLWRTNNAKAPVGPKYDCGYESGDETPPTGPDWFVIKPALSDPIPARFITAVAAAKGNSDVVYVGYFNGRIEKTVNGTAVSPVWTIIDDNAGTNPLPNRMVTRITVDPGDASGQTIYATFGGFNSDNLWRSVNGGAGWTNIHTGLPAVPVRDLKVHPANSQWVYAATEVGIFTSENAGSAWFLPHDGPANVPVDELFFMGTKIVAVTHGRGMFTSNTDPSNDPPTASTIASQHLYSHMPKTLSFTVGDGGDGDLDNLVVTPVFSRRSTQVVIGGSGATRTATVTAYYIPAYSTPETITIRVSDGTHVVTTSFEITVTQAQLPRIDPIPDQSAVVGVPLTVNVSIADDDTPVEELTLDAHVAGSPAVLPQANVVVGGTGATRTVTMTPIGVGTTTLNVRPYDPQGLTTNSPATFTLTVTGSTAPGLQPAVVSRPNVFLQWTRPGSGPAPTGYTVVASLSAGGPVIASLPVGLATSVNVPAPDGTFYVRVVAAGPGGSVSSNEITVVVAPVPVPTAPQNLAAVVNGNTFGMTWSPPANAGVAQLLTYVIEAGRGPGLSDLANFATGGTTTQFVTPVVPNGSYYMRVRARGTGGTGPVSNEIRVVVGPPPPGAPVLSGSTGPGGSVSLSWTAPATGAAVTGYQLQAGTAPGSSNAAVMSLPASQLTFSTAGVPPGTYYVRVVATSAVGLGAPSNEIVLAVP